MVIGKIAIVHQRFVHTDKRVCAAGMPDAAFGGVTLVSNPAMRLYIIEQVVLRHLLGVSDNFEYHDVAPVRQDKGLLVAQRGIEPLVELI